MVVAAKCLIKVRRLRAKKGADRGGLFVARDNIYIGLPRAEARGKLKLGAKGDSGQVGIRGEWSSGQLKIRVNGR